MTLELRRIRALRVSKRMVAVSGACGLAWATFAAGQDATGKDAQGKDQGALHGAQAMDAQLRRMNKLVEPGQAVAPPAGVSKLYFQALIPEDFQGSKEEVALGNKLYFDRRLSGDGSVACATCHDVSRGFTDRRNTSEGIGGKVGRRNAPTTLNSALFQTQFWDGRATTLEDQARLPITNPIEMGMKDEQSAVDAIKDDQEYIEAFQKIYGTSPNMDDLTRAIAAFERTLIFLDAPIDRFLRGDAKAISADARAGFALFNGKGRCNSCHQMSPSNPIGTDNLFHNIGVSARHQDFESLAKKALAALAKDDSKDALDSLALETELSELGRFVVTRSRADIGAFKTEQVRNVGITAPYMHDGSLQTMWDVMDHYNKGGEANLYLDGGIEPLKLSEKEIDQLVAFLFSLTDDRFAEDNQAEFQRQKALAASKRPFRDEKLANREKLPFETNTGEKK